MDRFRQKGKKDKPQKHVDKEKTPTFISDVKSFKENLKIKEILRTVKMNSSMRIKAPRGSKVMNSKDFNDNDDYFEETNVSSEVRDEESDNPPSATNPDVVLTAKDTDEKESDTEDQSIKSDETDSSSNFKSETDLNTDNTVEKVEETITIPVVPTDAQDRKNSDRDTRDIVRNNSVLYNSKYLQDVNGISKYRERKLSLDHTLLNRREGLSQSELDLNSIGKSPLERKSSFFRKKMDSFLKNTSEIFKRQSLGTGPQGVQRRGSMSVSLQSLGESASASDRQWQGRVQQLGSESSLQSNSTAASSASGAGAAPALPTNIATSAHSLNESYIQDSMLNSRAISMSSGLDSAHGHRRRKTSRSNRPLTWVASEGLTNYFRRMLQDENGKEIHGCYSYSDFTTIPENNLCGPKVDSKGRRLSYQRAVSGEDPAPPPPPRHDRRRQPIPEHSESHLELTRQLTEFSRNGVPKLQGYGIAGVANEPYACFLWAERGNNLNEIYDRAGVPPEEEARQTVIRELISTEVHYIRHLISIVEVFIAAAHALQDSGKMLGVDTARLFSNIPDVLNASMHFWELTLYPMVSDAVEHNTPFNTELMAAGFCRFREVFTPYEKYVSEQTKVLDYLKSLSGNSEFMMYLEWCHSQKSCERLKLSDILAKPMQRLTKYSLILSRLGLHTDTEPERSNLSAMESYAKNYVLDLNRTIRQREELERMDLLAHSIENYELDFKDDDMDKAFKSLSHANLRAPMVNCTPCLSRVIVYEGDLKLKDLVKESEVRVFLLTDMLLFCKKNSKGSPFTYKLVRPKVMINKLVLYAKSVIRNGKEVSALLYLVVDDVGTSYNCLMFSESAKDTNPQLTLKLWDIKIREARKTYDMSVWLTRNRSRDFSEADFDSSADYSGASGKGKQNSEDLNIERDARERVATMMHRMMGASTEHDFSQASMYTDSFDAGEPSGASGMRTPAVHGRRFPMQRNSTGGSSRNSRLSSFQKSTSAPSHDEPQPGPSRYSFAAATAAASVEHLMPPSPLQRQPSLASIIVNVVSESDPDTVVSGASPCDQLSVLKMGSRSPSTSHNTLRVQPLTGPLALVHSLPDFSVEPQLRVPSPNQQSASEKLYQSHQELLQRNRLMAAQHQYLRPDHRGTSYPPPSPSRASLTRGLAFSYSFKHPPLWKMGHVNSQQAEATPSTSKGDKRDVSPVAGRSADKPEKKSKNARNKGSSGRSDDETDTEASESGMSSSGAGGAGEPVAGPSGLGRGAAGAGASGPGAGGRRGASSD